MLNYLRLFELGGTIGVTVSEAGDFTHCIKNGGMV